MITLKSFVPVMISLFLLATQNSFAQKGKHKHGHPHHHHGGKVVVVKRSPFRPKKVVVYRPVWGPKHMVHRRWVYFPKYNLYWDNWRSLYVFRSGAVWVTKPSPPPVVVNINLENEKHYELKENEDDVDDVYKGNDDHQKEYKPE